MWRRRGEVVEVSYSRFFWSGSGSMENIMDPDPAKWCGSFESGSGSAILRKAISPAPKIKKNLSWSSIARVHTHLNNKQWFTLVLYKVMQNNEKIKFSSKENKIKSFPVAFIQLAVQQINSLTRRQISGYLCEIKWNTVYCQYF